MVRSPMLIAILCGVLLAGSGRAVSAQVCGDGTCNGAENPLNCLDDCPATIGGIVFQDEANPLFNGLNGVSIHIEGINGTVADIDLVTSGNPPASGNWGTELFEGTYRVSMSLTGYCFTEYLFGDPVGPAPYILDVNPNSDFGRLGSQFIFAYQTAGPCPCDDNGDCDDHNACTADLCQLSGQGQETCPDNASCDPQDPGACGEVPSDCILRSYCNNLPGQNCCFVDADCADGDACTINTCGQGDCESTPSSDPDCCNVDADCDDGDDCTHDVCINDSCQNNLIGDCCIVDNDCDDGNACTDDACVQNACQYTNNSASCDDGDACTENDSCSGGSCGGAPIVCDDGNACTDDSCVGGSCQFTNNSDVCNDGDACTENDTCAGGSCSGSAIVCDDGNTCTDDSCVGGQCQFSNNTAACDDGDGCTMNDTCSNGSCDGAPVVCDDGNGCTDDSCVGGSCQFTNNSDACNDGDACTQNDVCSGGSCSGSAIVCDDGNACTDDSCVGGSCQFDNNTAVCDDGDACTYHSTFPGGLDACIDGQCQADSNACTATIGGLVTDDPAQFFGAGLPGVKVTLGCVQTPAVEATTNAEGIWSAQVVVGDTCTLSIPTTGPVGLPTTVEADAYWGLPGSWLYDTGTDGPVCPLQRVPGDLVHVVTGEPATDLSILAYVVPQGVNPCEFCSGQVAACELGDWDGNGYVTVVTDVPLVIDGVFFSTYDGICLWSADMDGDGALTVVNDVQMFLNKLIFGIDYGACTDAGQ